MRYSQMLFSLIFFSLPAVAANKCPWDHDIEVKISDTACQTQSASEYFKRSNSENFRQDISELNAGNVQMYRKFLNSLNLDANFFYQRKISHILASLTENYSELLKVDDHDLLVSPRDLSGCHPTEEHGFAGDSICFRGRVIFKDGTSDLRDSKKDLALIFRAYRDHQKIILHPISTGQYQVVLGPDVAKPKTPVQNTLNETVRYVPLDRGINPDAVDSGM